MTFDNLQAEIKSEADLLGVEVLMGLWNRVKTLSDNDVSLYCTLIDIYTNFRIYHHRVKRWINDAYDFGDNSSNKQYCNWMAMNKMCQDFFQEAAVKKYELREKLTLRGINYRQFHPHTHHLEMQKIFNYPCIFDDPKKLDLI